MKALRDAALRRAWRKLAAEAPRVPEGPMQWGGNSRALVLYDADDPRQAGQAAALTLADFGVDERLPHSKRAPELLAWTATVPSVPEAAGAPTDALAWHPKRLAFSGLPKPEAAAAVLAKAYDLVVNLHPRAFPPFDYLAASARAHLRAVGHDEAGDWRDGEPVYDLVIRATPARFVPELRAYLRALNPTI